ncbi:hypothetical protein P691DRAFT_780881 [Macrolepiota fuliginosa MF-IS2]|uniref:Auxin efflux carrier n=1 Tax=Macrolepiota fuliginosa MF-IS2 TaxID=1400762 RepID=A0A9P5X010_9AGAR|nr:hypothetical protein P691DRAFT_780881 [Macrolepiota fuliginosa MF-IS2]
MSPSAGTLIWISSKPLIRLAVGIASEFVITKADIFPLVAARGAGQIVLNITTPCLLFSKIVPAFTTDNVRALGPLVLVALLYEALGIALAWIIRQIFWVPHCFQHGILVAGGWGNVGDLPTAVILSITGSAPFHGTPDQNLAVAYISIFILVFTITLFPCGFHRCVAWDFTSADIEPEIIRAKIKAQRQRLLRFLSKGRQGSSLANDDGSSRDEEKAVLPDSPRRQGRSDTSIEDVTTAVVTLPDGIPKPSPTPSREVFTYGQSSDGRQGSPLANDGGPSRDEEKAIPPDNPRRQGRNDTSIEDVTVDSVITHSTLSRPRAMGYYRVNTKEYYYTA